MSFLEDDALVIVKLDGDWLNLDRKSTL